MKCMDEMGYQNCIYDSEDPCKFDGVRGILQMAAIAMVFILIAFGLFACGSGDGSGAKTSESVSDSVVLGVDVYYESNLLFAKYDVEVRVDGSTVGDVSQGNSLTQEISLQKGAHEIQFYKKGKNKAYAQSRFSLDEDSRYECSIKSHNSEIDINNERVETMASYNARISEEKAAKEREEEEKQKAEAERQAEKERKEAERKAAEDERNKAEQDKLERIDSCQGQTAIVAKAVAEECDYHAKFVDQDGKDLSDIIADDDSKSAAKDAVVTGVKAEDGWFGSKNATFELKYSAKQRIESCKGKVASKAASVANNNGYQAEFYDKSGDEITDEVIGDSKVKAARKASVKKVEVVSEWGDKAKFTLDYGVPKDYKTALKSAESYNRLMHMSKAGLYDQLTSEYGEKYSAEAAQYAVDNLEANWKENALITARNYQDMMNMSPAAIYDQLVSQYGEQFTAEEAQYAIDNL